MANNLQIFGTGYQNVVGFMATDSNGKVITYKPGLDGWTVLHDSTTTESAILQIPITNIEANEFFIHVICTPASNVSIYASPNNTTGDHYAYGYGRTYISTGTTTGNPKYGTIYIHHQLGNNFLAEISGMNYAGTAGTINYMHCEATEDMDPYEKYTAISVASYQALPAGTRIIVLGR